MARLRYNGLTATLGAALTSSATSVTFGAALTHAAGSVPTIASPDYLPLTIVDSSGNVSEIVSLTAYTSGAVTGTISRAQEGTTGVAHSSGDKVIHGPTALDAAGDTAWTTATLTNSWVNYGAPYGSAGYRKDGQGAVRLRGLVKSGAAGTVMFTLPAGYRPAEERFFGTNAGSTMGELHVKTDGSVVLAVGTTTYVQLDGITFYAEA